MIDINNSKSLPEADKVALAAASKVSIFEFSRAGMLKASWEDYYRSLLVDPYDYYEANFAGTPIFRYLQTHPDMDHMNGLFRFWLSPTPTVCSKPLSRCERKRHLSLVRDQAIPSPWRARSLSWRPGDPASDVPI